MKWLTPLFEHERRIGAETEFENGLSCEDCLPSCQQIQYSVSSTKLPLQTLPAQSRGFMYVYIAVRATENLKYKSRIHNNVNENTNVESRYFNHFNP